MNNVILTPLVLVLTLILGSFANVLIYRIPRGIQFVTGRSACPGCGFVLKPYELIPVVSYVFLGGRCRRCKAPISIKYPIVELMCGALGFLAARQYGFTIPALTYFAVWYILLVIAFIDAGHMIIPDGLTISLAVVVIIHAVTQWNGLAELADRGLGFVIISLPMLLLTLLIKDAFGGGDIKLIAVCGFLMGWQLTLVAGFAAVLLGGVIAIYIKFIKRDKNTKHMAFGPCLCAGVFIATLYGEQLLKWYTGLWMY